MLDGWHGIGRCSIRLPVERTFETNPEKPSTMRKTFFGCPPVHQWLAVLTLLCGAGALPRAEAAGAITAWDYSNHLGRYLIPDPNAFSQIHKWSMAISPTGGGPQFWIPARGPLLGAELPPLPSGPAGEVAETLRPYVAEPFFGPLSVLVQRGPMAVTRARMLERYQAQKDAAVAALCAELEAAQALAPNERRARLVAFADSQAAAVAAVEAQAEEIRRDFCAKRVLEPGVDWEGMRTWHLDDPERSTPGLDRFVLLHGAAAFGAGFTIEQRGLLQEAAMDAAADGLTPADEGDLLFFSPSCARFLLPAGLSETLVGQVAVYRDLRESIKEELRDIVLAHDHSNSRVRDAAYAELAERQADRLRRLEDMADEIRLGLAGRLLPGEPAKPLVPASLGREVDAYLGAKVATQRAFVAKLAEVRAAVPGGSVEIVPCKGGYEIRIGSGAPSGDAAIMQSLAAFNADQARHYADLLRMKRELVQALRERAPGLLESQERPMDELLKDFVGEQFQREHWNKYWAYRKAVLEPGLSAGQRRLLFRAAVEALVAPYIR